MQLQAFSKNSTTSRLPVRANWEGVVVRYLARRGASGHRPLSGVIGQRLRGTAATGHRPRSATSYRSRRVVCGGSFGHRPHSARVSASSTGHRPRTFGDGSTRLTSAAAPSPRDLMNWIGNLPGWEPIYYPDGFRPSRPWVNPFMRVLGWETSWGDRHTARMSEVEALSRAQRIVTGEGAGRLWLDHCNLKGQNTSCKDLAWEASCPCGVTGSGKHLGKKESSVRRRQTTDDRRRLAGSIQKEST